MTLHDVATYILETIMSTLSISIATVVAGIAVLFNLPSKWLSPAEKASLKYLSDAILQKFDSEKTRIKAAELWKDHGAVIMAVRRPG